jgi:hypothetical protein
LKNCLQIAESVLNATNEAIREQENEERLRVLSNSLKFDGLHFVRPKTLRYPSVTDSHASQGIDLGAPSRLVGNRRILKEGTVTKGLRDKKLEIYLFNDMILLAAGDIIYKDVRSTEGREPRKLIFAVAYPFGRMRHP